jgi:hypothetical protein
MLAAPRAAAPNTQIIFDPSKESPVKAEVRTDERAYGPSQGVQVSLIVTNVSDQALHLVFSSPCQALLTVTDPAGTELFSQYNDSCLLTVLSYLDLEPGQSHTYPFGWGRRDPKGNSVVGPLEVKVTGTLLSNEVSFPTDATSVLLDPPCLDGLDNDRDLLTDYPDDPGCSTAGDFDEENPRPTLPFTVRTDHEAYFPGQRVKAAFHVSNTGTEPITFVSTQTCLANLQIMTVDGLTLDICNERCGGPSSTHTLQPGETRTTLCTWDQLDFDGFPVSTPDELAVHGFIYYAFRFPDDTQASSRILVGPACSDHMDNDRDGWVDYLDDPQCAAPTDRDEVASPFLTMTPDGLDWSLVPGAEAYDVVYGDLLDVSRPTYNGNFIYLTLGCLADDVAAGPIKPTPEPLPGEVRWFLVRPIVGGVPGTYDSSPATQVGWRDKEIEVSGFGCR